MKKLYEINDRHGRVLCYQVAETDSDALNFARMCGHTTAIFASCVRND